MSRYPPTPASATTSNEPSVSVAPAPKRRLNTSSLDAWAASQSTAAPSAVVIAAEVPISDPSAVVITDDKEKAN